MSEQNNATIQTEKKSNPGPLGLLGFGMTTVLLNLHNAGIIELSVVIVAMGFALGGLAQIIAGIFEMKHGNTFAGTAFTAYGLFWWSLIFIWANPAKEIAPADATSLAFYLLLWGVFTLCMFIGTLRHNRATQVVFLSLTVLFFGLSLGDFTGVEQIHLASGWIGIFCGASAIYNAMGQVINEEFGKAVVPLG
ncbi:MAG: acetate uptake transporter [Clostridiales Family XIII bacterium]|jgi:succinate-acetate transporter protein|nr:acetate uptake transporter [Clostridiales Family XIII bacterium]